MKDIVIFGAGGFGREIPPLIWDINMKTPNSYRLLGYIVDQEYWQPNTTVNGYPLLGDVEWLVAHKDSICCTIAIGKAKEREAVFRRLDALGVEIETLISPSVYIHPTCKIGRGCYIGFRSLLSVNTDIGNGVFLNSDVMLGHDLQIGDFTTIYPRATISGNCSIGSNVEIGGAAYIVPGRKVGDGAVVAAGSVVFSNVKANIHVMGNPAKRIEL